MSQVVNAKRRKLRTVSEALKVAIAEEHVLVQNASHLHGFVAGLKHGEVTLEGDSGDYLGVLNDGASIHVQGNAGRYLADNMTGGHVTVQGDAGYGAGQYCYGGTIVIHGNAGDFTAVMNKGATILIQGDVGDDAATYMLAGDLIVIGNAGKNLGNYLIRGNIYIGGTWESLGHNTLITELLPDDVAKLRSLFEMCNIEVEPTHFKKIVRLSEKPFYKAQDALQREPDQAAISADG